MTVLVVWLFDHDLERITLPNPVLLVGGRQGSSFDALFRQWNTLNSSASATLHGRSKRILIGAADSTESGASRRTVCLDKALICLPEQDLGSDVLPALPQRSWRYSASLTRRSRD